MSIESDQDMTDDMIHSVLEGDDGKYGGEDERDKEAN